MQKREMFASLAAYPFSKDFLSPPRPVSRWVLPALGVAARPA